MAELRNIFQPAPGTRPRLACEIRAEGVIAARAAAEKGSEGPVLAFEPLPAGVLTPGLKTPNLVDRAAVLGALESALGAVNARGSLTLVVPDASARVLLLDFDTLPGKRQDALPVVRFRVRKMVPFDVDSASVSYQVMSHKPGQISVLVTVMPADVLAEYESIVREAAYEPGVVLPSTLAAVAGLGHAGSALVVNHSRFAVTTVVTQDDEMLLHRTIDLSGDLSGASAARDEEMAQAVITTLAWYEDTLRATPGALHYAGPGGVAAAMQSQWLRFVGSAPPLEDLAHAGGASTLTSVPPGLTAGVTGALAQ